MDISSNITYRWIDGPTCSQEDWDAIDEKLAARGWMSLNRHLSRARIAECDGKIVGIYCLQHVPHVEPLIVDRSTRGTGVAQQLADDMQEYLTEHNARGFMAICEHPIAAQMCEARGMVKVPYPVYMSVPEETK